MQKRIVQFSAVFALGAIALATSPKVGVAEKACSNGLVICTRECPAYPNLVCEGYGCGGAGASCSFQNCGGLEYAITCTAGN
jgi:hypothetical protein